jgi:uncharacterized SAM-binding protein YcdF (DUF218 family)
MPEQKRPNYLKRIVFALVAAAWLWVFGLVSFVNNIPNKIDDPETVTDGIVILTGGSNRLDAGIKLLFEQKGKKLFVSGVGKETNLASLLILSGSLPNNIAELTEKIELGYDATNTRQNAEETARWVKENNYKSIRLVTSNYHIYRSLIEFKKQMPDVNIIPYPVIPDNFSTEKWWQNGSTKKLLVSEYNKYLASKIISLN